MYTDWKTKVLPVAQDSAAQATRTISVALTVVGNPSGVTPPAPPSPPPSGKWWEKAYLGMPLWEWGAIGGGAMVVTVILASIVGRKK